MIEAEEEEEEPPISSSVTFPTFCLQEEEDEEEVEHPQLPPPPPPGVRINDLAERSNMNEFRLRPNASWAREPTSPPETTAEGEGPWSSLGTSMSAISLGFVATAVLVSMFLIMAIFEHLLKRRPSWLFLFWAGGGHVPSRTQGAAGHSVQSPAKLVTPQNIVAPRQPEVSVLMPGQEFPTYIAQPAPLPCPREGVAWPSHDQHHHNKLPQP